MIGKRTVRLVRNTFNRSVDSLLWNFLMAVEGLAGPCLERFHALGICKWVAAQSC